VKTPAWHTYDCASVTADAVCADMSLPLVVKPDDSGSSIGVSIVKTRETSWIRRPCRRTDTRAAGW
jgi:D-alanine-D-alanine ligase-like ATP-grasp enzyme